MKIAFVNPPSIYDGKFGIEAEDCCWGRSARRILPYALLSAASQVKRHDVKYFDMAIDEVEETCEINEFGPDAVVYPVVYQELDELVRVTRELPGRHVRLAYPPGYADELVERDKYVIYSEPEQALGFLDSYNYVRKWAVNTPGIVYRGKLQENTTPMNNQLHLLNDIDYSLVPEHYWPYYRLAVYQVTRGCPYRCHFCSWGGSTVTDRTFRRKDPAQVARDICSLRDHANRHRGTDRNRPIPLYLLASQMSGSVVWLKKFHRLMSPRPYPFQTNVNAHELTAEKLRLLMESGLRTTSIGVECLTDRLLKKINKPHTFDEVLAAVNLLEGAEISYSLHFRYGFGETETDIEESLENLDELKKVITGNMCRMDIGPFIYYKGTRLRDKVDTCELKPLELDSRVRFMSKKGISRMQQYAEPPSNIDDLINAVKEASPR